MSFVKKVTDHCCDNPFLFKYITFNDAGITKSHQAGFHLPKNAWPLIFEREGKKGELLDNFGTITWTSEDGKEIDTTSRFEYYGKKTRNEYRLTQMGRNFPFRNDQYFGSLLVLSKDKGGHYLAWIICSEESKNQFIEFFGISPLDSGRYIDPQTKSFLFNNKPEKKSEEKLFEELLSPFPNKFPSGSEMCRYSIDIANEIHGRLDIADEKLLKRIETEYKLYQFIEKELFEPKLKAASETIGDFLKLSLSIQNSRKSRAGHSLENHLEAIFSEYGIKYTNNGVTEGNKKPDFIFPGIKEYHNPAFPENKLVFLGAKTSCKDRWRQILAESDRIKRKHLITLEQGISLNQVNEMISADVQLVIPQDYTKFYPQKIRDSLLTLSSFIKSVLELQDGKNEGVLKLSTGSHFPVYIHRDEDDPQQVASVGDKPAEVPAPALYRYRKIS